MDITVYSLEYISPTKDHPADLDVIDLHDVQDESSDPIPLTGPHYIQGSTNRVVAFSGWQKKTVGVFWHDPRVLVRIVFAANSTQQPERTGLVTIASKYGNDNSNVSYRTGLAKDTWVDNMIWEKIDDDTWHSKPIIASMELRLLDDDKLGSLTMPKIVSEQHKITVRYHRVNRDGYSTDSVFTQNVLVTHKKPFTNSDYPVVYREVIECTCQWAAHLDFSKIEASQWNKTICDTILEKLPESGLKYGVAAWHPTEMLWSSNRGGMCGGWGQLFLYFAASQGIELGICFLAVDWRQPLWPGRDEVAWHAMVIRAGGLNRTDGPTHAVRNFQDAIYNNGKLKLLGSTEQEKRWVFYGAEPYISSDRKAIPQYRDGHVFNLLRSDGKVYLYDACFQVTAQVDADLLTVGCVDKESGKGGLCSANQKIDSVNSYHGRYIAKSGTLIRDEYINRHINYMMGSFKVDNSKYFFEHGNLLEEEKLGLTVEISTIPDKWRPEDGKDTSEVDGLTFRVIFYHMPAGE